MPTWLAVMVALTIPVAFVGVVVVFVLGFVFSSDAARSDHPVTAWLARTLGAALLLVVCAAATWIMWRSLRGVWTLRLRGVTADATVLGVRVVDGGPEDPDEHWATVRVTTPDGATREFEARAWAGDQVEAGACVPVRYHPSFRTPAHVLRRSALHTGGELLGELVVLLFAVGAAGASAALAYLLFRQLTG